MNQTKFIVIFRSRLNEGIDEEYQQTAARMFELVRQQEGFIAYKSYEAPDGDRVTIEEFANEEAILEWRAHPEHQEAQRLGKEKFYSWYHIQVCEVMRDYSFGDK